MSVSIILDKRIHIGYLLFYIKLSHKSGVESDILLILYAVFKSGRNRGVQRHSA